MLSYFTIELTVEHYLGIYGESLITSALQTAFDHGTALSAMDASLDSCLGPDNYDGITDLEVVPSLAGQNAALRRELAHLKQKVEHKCIDAWCEQCDGPRKEATHEPSRRA